MLQEIQVRGGELKNNPICQGGGGGGWIFSGITHSCYSLSEEQNGKLIFSALCYCGISL